MPPPSFLSLLKPYRGKLTLAFFCIVLANLLALVLPWAVKFIIDDILAKGNSVALPYILWTLLFVSLARSIVSYGALYLGRVVGEKVARDLRARLHQHLLRLSVIYIENIPTGTLIQRVTGDMDAIRRFLLSGILDFLYSFLGAGFVLLALFWLDFRLAFISMLFFPVFIITYLKLAGKLEEKHKSLSGLRGRLSGKLGELFRGIRTVHAFQRQAYEARRFSSDQSEILRKASEAYRIDAGFLVASEFLSALGLIVLLGFGAFWVLEGRMTLGTLMAFYAYMGMIFLPLARMAVINTSFQEAKASLGLVREILNQSDEPREARQALTLREIKGEVEFQDVSFNYDGNRQALSGVNLKARPGEVVALVGPSGAGKSTLIGLLARFFDPLSGRILVDGHDLRSLKIESYRSKIALVLQTDFLFDETVRQNLLYGNLEARFEAVVSAAKAANIHDFIMKLPDQYYTTVGEGGVKLSGGERQRIAIARALLRDPAILMLDEATSAVDSVMEDQIAIALKNLMKGRTTFVIAHRLSTVKAADKIVVLDQGRIVAEGRHEELIPNCKLYRELCRTQMVGYPHPAFSLEGRGN